MIPRSMFSGAHGPGGTQNRYYGLTGESCYVVPKIKYTCYNPKENDKLK